MFSNSIDRTNISSQTENTMHNFQVKNDQKKRHTTFEVGALFFPQTKKKLQNKFPNETYRRKGWPWIMAASLPQKYYFICLAVIGAKGIFAFTCNRKSFFLWSSSLSLYILWSLLTMSVSREKFVLSSEIILVSFPPFQAMCYITQQYME